MKTLSETIKAWNEGKKQEAYDLYLKDEGSMLITFNQFCEMFPHIIKTHRENEEAQKAHSKLIYD